MKSLYPLKIQKSHNSLDLSTQKIKRAALSYWLETTTDSKRDALIKQQQHITMYFFIEAIDTRDFKKLNALLPHLYKLDPQKILHTYNKAICQDSIFDTESKLWNAKNNIENCQKDLINKSHYTEDDVWLLVMFALLHPYIAISPLCDNYMVLSMKSFTSGHNLALNYSKLANKKSQFDQYIVEARHVSEKLHILSEQYFNKEKSSEIIEAKKSSESNFTEHKQHMENMNLFFNIINVFAWLPLLLTNFDRLFSGKSLRLFHYVGLDYNHKVTLSMLEVYSHSVTQSTPLGNNQRQADVTPQSIDCNYEAQLKSILDKNTSINAYKLTFNQPLSADEIQCLVKYMASNRTICDISYTAFEFSRHEYNELKKRTDRNKVLTYAIPRMEDALQTKKPFEQLRQLKVYTSNDGTVCYASPLNLDMFVRNYFTNNQNKWNFTQEEITPQEKNRISDAYNLYHAVYAINNSNFCSANNLLRQSYTEVGEKIIIPALRATMLVKISDITEFVLAEAILKELKADLSQKSNRAILANQSSCLIIQLLIRSGIPIKYDYFDALPDASTELLEIFKNMQEQNSITSENTSKVFTIYAVIMQTVQSASNSIPTSPDKLINDASCTLSQDIKDALLNIAHQNSSTAPMHIF